MLLSEGNSICTYDYGIENMSESWKGPEEDNMSIGELKDYLSSIPTNRHHLPVKMICSGEAVEVNRARINFTDGSRYFADRILQGMGTFHGMYLEINGDDVV
jgi:hypothetical protein